jgi:hypothetical protein
LIHLARGDKPKVIAAGRDAFEAGFRGPTWQYKSAAAALMLDDPEWLALVDEIEADLARQRDWYEAHKDEPLF